jgi:hypothetical protein
MLSLLLQPTVLVFLQPLHINTKAERAMFPGVVACLMVNQGGTAGVPLVPLQDEGVFNEKMYAKERMP